MGSDLYQNPPKWHPHEYKIMYDEDDNLMTILRKAGYYDSPPPGRKWNIVFEETMTHDQVEMVNRLLKALDVRHNL